jgi:hypothetical protein
MKIIILIGTAIIMIGVILIYDARPLTLKLFGFGDQNEGALGLKITGYIITFIGTLITYFNI